jgi:tetratricopeptide (TPR) repeat protein
MKSRAYIAGDLNCAILPENGNGEIFFRSKDRSYPLDGYSLSQLYALNPEIKEIYYDSLSDLQTQIDAEHQRQEALEMALEVMDTELPQDYRNEIAGILSKDLDGNPQLLEFLENRLFSTPLPESFNPDEAKELMAGISERLASMYAEVRPKAYLFSCFYTAFRLNLNLEEGEQEVLDQKLTDSGCFARFANALYQRSKRMYDEAVLLAIPYLQELHVFEKRELFNDIEKALERNNGIQLTGHSDADLPLPVDRENTDNDPIIKLIDAYFDQRQKNKDRKRAKRGHGRRVKDFDLEIMDTVARMKDWAFEHGYDTSSFLSEFALIVKKQLRSSHPQDLCKTCCALAADFTDKRLFQLSEKLLEYAKRLNSDDPFVYNQEAGLFKAQNKLPEALELYELAIKKFGNDVVAYCGRAEVLMGIGRLDEALRQYEANIKKFENDVIVYNGRARVLRDMGRLDEALQQYRISMNKFNDDFAYCGLAEVLRDMGKLDEALAQYNVAVSRFDGSVAANCGRAAVLRDMGKFDEALAQYDITITKFENNPVAYNGRAAVLRDMGRSDEALLQYEDAIDQFINNVVAYSGRAEVLRDMGRFDEALLQYDVTIDKFPTDAIAYNGRAEVLRDMEKFDDALLQYDVTIHKFPNNAVAYGGRAEVLKDMQRFDEALLQYNAAVKKFDNNVVAYDGRAEVLRDMGKFNEALIQYEAIIRRFPNNPVAYNGRAEVLRDIGRFEEAFLQYGETINEFKNNIVAYNGRVEALRDMGRLDEALQESANIIRLFPFDNFARRSRLHILLITEKYQQFELEVEKDTYRSKNDQIELHMYCMYLIKTGDWEKAKEMLKTGMKLPFKKRKRYFRNTYAYLNILQKNFDAVLQELNIKTVRTPAESLLLIHANAASNNISEAIDESKKLDKFKRPVIRNTLNYISDRYFPTQVKTGKKPDELDQLIQQGEMLALMESIPD